MSNAMKKFYTLVSTSATPDGGFSIQLDGKPVKTLAQTPLVSPNENLANLIVAEWSEQGETIDPETMPVTQILTTCLDRVSKERDAMHDQVMAYLDTDLICYFHDDDTLDIHTWQQKAWTPWHDWFEKSFGQRLEITSGLLALKQNDDLRMKIAQEIAEYDDLTFTVFQLITSLSGSIVLALAFMREAITTEDIFKAAFVEELYRAELYNEELHGHAPHQEKKMDTMKRDLRACRSILCS